MTYNKQLEQTAHQLANGEPFKDKQLALPGKYGRFHETAHVIAALILVAGYMLASVGHELAHPVLSVGYLFEVIALLRMVLLG